MQILTRTQSPKKIPIPTIYFKGVHPIIPTVNYATAASPQITCHQLFIQL